MRRIEDWPSDERPRERLLCRGPGALTDAELLALLLRTGGGGDSALAQACRILERAGGVRELPRMRSGELVGVRGIGATKAASVVAACELGRRATEARIAPGESFRTSAAVYEHFRRRLAPLRKEVFLAVLLDTKHRWIRDVQVSEGSLTAAIVHPREVYVPAIRESAAAILVVHNHPSGDPLPSAEDREITRRLRRAGEVLGIRLLDHVVVGAGSHYSFADAGAL